MDMRLFKRVDSGLAESRLERDLVDALLKDQQGGSDFALRLFLLRQYNQN
jgi:hypothetical protein